MTTILQPLRILAAIIGLSIAGTASAAEDRFAGVKITAEKVAGSIYMLVGSGGNIGLSVGADATLSNIVELSANVEMIEETFRAVEVALAAGKTEDEIVAAGVAEKWKSHSWAFINEERWLKTLIAEASGGVASQRR